MTHRNIARNYIYNLTYQLLALLVPIITTPYVSRVLGAEGIGTYSYTYSIVTYFTLVAALGTMTYAQREIAYFQQNPKKISEIFWEIVVLRVIMVAICSIVYITFVQQIGNTIIGLVQGFYLLGVATDISWFFQGIEQFSKTVFRNILIKIVNVVFIFAFVRSSSDLVIYIWGMAFLPIIGNLLLWFYLPDTLVKVNLRKLHPLRHLKTTIQLFIPTVAIQIYTVLDKTMIGIFAESSAQNGYYEQSVGLVRTCLTVITALGTVMIPRISNTFATGNQNMLKSYMRKTFRFVWFLSLPIFGELLAIASTFVPWFFGGGFEDVVVLIQIFSFLVIAVGMSDIIGMQYLIPTKKQNILTFTVFIGALTNLGLNLVLIPLYAAKGAAIASVIAETAITIAQFIYIIYVEKSFTWNDILGTSWKYILSCIVMIISLSAIKLYMSDNVISTMILIWLGILIYIGMLLILKDDFIVNIISKIPRIIKEKQKK